MYQGFYKLKELLLSAPVIMNPDFSCPFILQTDPLEVGVGAVLSQTDAEGCDHPVAYLSWKLLHREQKYATIEKECLAIKLEVEAFQVYLLGDEFMIQTDHRVLQWLKKFKDSNNWLLRRGLVFQSFRCQVVHCKGQDNGNADSLSRQAEWQNSLRPEKGERVWQKGRGRGQLD